MKIAVFESPSDKRVQPVDLAWADLGKALADCNFTACNPCPGKNCDSKKGRAWSPVIHVEGADRHVDAQVASITAAVYDLDSPGEVAMAVMARALEGTEYLAHETHTGGSYRLVIALTSEIPAGDWPAVWPAIAARFAIPGDLKCGNPSRIYFTPSRPQGQSFAFFEGGGLPLDWRALDLISPAGAAGAAAQFREAARRQVARSVDPDDPAHFASGPVDLEELRRTVGALRRPESRDLLDTILGGRRLTESYPVDVGSRDDAINRAVSLLASAPLAKPYACETVIALLHGSIRAMDLEPEGIDHWLELARQKYRRAAGRRLERDAVKSADRVAILKILGQLPGDAPDADVDWRKRLLYLLDKDGSPTGLRAIGWNANLIARNDPAWKGSLRFNAITKEIDVFGGCLLHVPRASLDVEAANWLASSEYRLFLGSHEVGEQILAVARAQEYDPLRDWLTSVKWDQQDRVTDFFTDYLGAEGNAEHMRAISRCFLISCVARAMSPGCEVHTVPILIGKQGAGKSRSLRALGAPYFTDSKLNLKDKDSRILAASSWIIELAELAAVRGADIETIKAFISQAEDRVRPPYGRVHETFKRRCVYVGTTNEDEVLSDWTGNRRWWPIRVAECNVEGVRRDRDQIFAQALAMYRAGVQWHLTPAEAHLAEDIASDFKRAGARAEQILAWFALRAPHERPSELTTFDLLNTVLGVPSSQITAGMAFEIGRAAREVGFTKHRRRQGGSLLWVYRLPESIRLMPTQARPTAVEMVTNAEATSEVSK